MSVGVALEGNNKKYSQTTERPVHISMAALDPFQSHGKWCYMSIVASLC